MAKHVKLIAELGSCHQGKISYIFEAIDRCKDSGIDALKLQLFPNTAPYVPTNIYLPPETFIRAFKYARSKDLPLSASVFDKASFDFLQELNPPFIKFAYSKKDQRDMIEDSLALGIETIVSCDVMTDQSVNPKAVKLYCIPEYPVRYEVNFDELFPRFDGFSDHTLGTRQTKKALKAGAKIIEKHVRLGKSDETCPDAQFAVLIEEFAKVRNK